MAKDPTVCELNVS